LSKLGFCSRKQATELALAGRVSVNGTIRRDPEWPVEMKRDVLLVDGQPVRDAHKFYVALNKPRGLVTTAADEKGRATVFTCLEGKGYPFLAPVGRLDQASEGLLLFTNDTAWAARITDPATHLPKTYHVQIDHVATPELLTQLLAGVTDAGEKLAVKTVSVLRHGEKNSWLEIVLDEGRNRHIRRLLTALEIEVLRLIRIGIGRVQLGNLRTGEVRSLTDAEVRLLAA
jgi:23S rRNA pseudouridine2605 synthase